MHIFSPPSGKLYVVGGSDGTASLASVESFDPASGTWSFCPSLSVPRANVSAAVVRNRLYAVGGFSGKAFLDTMEYLTGTDDRQDWCGFVPVKNVDDGSGDTAREQGDAAKETSPPRETPGEHGDGPSENGVH